jgi:hypothetical protein
MLLFGSWYLCFINIKAKLPKNLESSQEFFGHFAKRTVERDPLGWNTAVGATVSGFTKVAFFTTNVHSENQSLIIHI